MSRPTVQRKALTLPTQLRQELGIGAQSSKAKKTGYGVSQGRKERRRAERKQKKVAKGRTGNFMTQTRVKNGFNDYGNDRASSESDSTGPAPPEKWKHNPPASEHTVPAAKPKLKSILKRTPLPRPSSPPQSLQSSDLSRSSSPGLVLDSRSKAFRDRAAQDDAEISALQKKLGLKSKKLPQFFDQDGLADLLEGLDSDVESTKRKREEKSWLQRKRRKSDIDYGDRDEGEEDLNLEDIDGDSSGGADSDFADPDEDMGRSHSENTDFEDFDLEGGEEPAPLPPKKRENPYVAPVSIGSTAAKYVPPSRRKALDMNTEALQRLRRQIQGHLNKLSEANLVSILSAIENLYQSHARQEVTSTLVDLLLGLFCDPSSLRSTFVILHAAFIAAAYK